jgi:hypothetical protein
LILTIFEFYIIQTKQPGCNILLISISLNLTYFNFQINCRAIRLDQLLIFQLSRRFVLNVYLCIFADESVAEIINKSFLTNEKDSDPGFCLNHIHRI